MGEAFPISGNIDPASFPFLLANLHQHEATGSLKVDGPNYQKALYFRGGRVLFGSSNDPRDQLGAILIDAGRLTADQLEEANAQVGPGKPLAKVLADSGIVGQRDLAEAAKTKVELILADLIGMQSGAFEFEDDVLPKGAIDLKLVTPRLFVAATRRVADPAFVARHLDQGQARLRATVAQAQLLSEALPEGSTLPAQLDGSRTLSQAAALAGLDAGEAGALACALLFLGAFEKGAPSGPVFEMVDGDLDADLAQTARLALGSVPAPGAPASRPAPAPRGPLVMPAEIAATHDADAADTPFFLSTDAPTLPPLGNTSATLDFDAPFEPPVEPVAPRPAATPPRAATDAGAEPESAPTLIVAPPPPVPAAPVTRPELEGTRATPPPAERQPIRGGRADLPLIPPPPRRVAPKVERPEPDEPELAPRQPLSRPSKEDLEALDTLLHARPIERPLATSTTAAPPARRAPAWDPSFGRNKPTRGRGTVPSRGSRLPVILVALAALGGAGAAAWYLWLRPRPVPAEPVARPTDVAAARTSAPPSAATDAAATPAPVATPAATPPASPPPTPEPRATENPVDAARAALRRGDLAAAGRGFRQMLAASPRGTYSIQILVACAPETVMKAVASAGEPELFVVPVNYQGRACHRLCWGVYDGRDRAESARRSLPAYFREGGASPRVVAAAELLP